MVFYLLFGCLSYIMVNPNQPFNDRTRDLFELFNKLCLPGSCQFSTLRDYLPYLLSAPVAIERAYFSHGEIIAVKNAGSAGG